MSSSLPRNIYLNTFCFAFNIHAFFPLGNDGCSSGGSQGGQLSPHTMATSIDSSNNKIALVIQLSLWVEEIIYEKF